VNNCLSPVVFSAGHPDKPVAPNLSYDHRPFSRGGIAMMSVVEWFAPIRNAAWVAACFGSLGE